MSGGFFNIRSLIEIQRRPGNAGSSGVTMKWSQTIGGRGVDREAALSQQEVDELIRLLNAANLPTLNGQKYRQAGLADGFNEVLSLSLGDGRKFVVQNYGDQAPPDYYKITDYLRQLQQKKFLSTDSD
jgi:hypothetical protein